MPWAAAAGSRRPKTAPAELRRTESPSRPGLPQDRLPPLPGVGRHRCLLLPRRDRPGGPSASPNTAAGGDPAYGAATAAASALTGSAARGPRLSRAQPSPPGRGCPATLRWIARSCGRRRPGKRQHWPSPHRPPLASVSGARAGQLSR